MFGTIQMECVIFELCYKGKFYKGIIGKWSFFYNSFVNFSGKKNLGATT